MCHVLIPSRPRTLFCKVVCSTPFAQLLKTGHCLIHSEEFFTNPGYESSHQASAHTASTFSLLEQGLPLLYCNCFFQEQTYFFILENSKLPSFRHLWCMLLCPNLPEVLIFTPGRCMPHVKRQEPGPTTQTSHCLRTVCGTLTLLLNYLITFMETNRLHTFELFLNFLVFSVDVYVYPYAITTLP